MSKEIPTTTPEEYPVPQPGPEIEPPQEQPPEQQPPLEEPPFETPLEEPQLPE